MKSVVQMRPSEQTLRVIRRLMVMSNAWACGLSAEARTPPVRLGMLTVWHAVAEVANMSTVKAGPMHIASRSCAYLDPEPFCLPPGMLYYCKYS